MLALGDDGRTESGAKIVGKFDDLVVAIDLNGSLRGIADHVAVVAPLQMFFKLCLGAGIDDPIEIVGELL